MTYNYTYAKQSVKYLDSSRLAKTELFTNLVEVREECKHLGDSDIRLFNLLNAGLKAIELEDLNKALHTV